jgi:hypothetical protein
MDDNWYVKGHMNNQIQTKKGRMYIVPREGIGRVLPPILSNLPGRLRHECRESKPIVVLVLLQIGECNQEESRQFGGRFGGDDRVPDLNCVFFHLLCCSATRYISYRMSEVAANGWITETIHSGEGWNVVWELILLLGHRWSVVEGHFLQMGGILLHHDGQYEYPYLGIGAFHESPDLCPPADRGRMGPSEAKQTKIRRAGYDNLQGLHDLMSKQEIQERSKSDRLAKLVVLVQTAWLTGQCLARAVQKLAITELEIATVAYTALNGVMYFFWWNKPLDVQFPLVIEVVLPQDEGTVAQAPLPSLPPPHGISRDNEIQLVAETPYSSPGPGESSRFTQQVPAVRERLGPVLRAEKARGGCLSLWCGAGRWWDAGMFY